MSHISDSYNQFAFGIYKHLGAGQDKNVFLSPYSIVSALSMCLAGARNDTEKQLKQVLNYSQLSNDVLHNSNAALIQHLSGLQGAVALNVANKVYPSRSYNIKQEFLDLLKKNYQSDVEKLDFGNAAESSKVINSWVEKQTNSKIKDLVPESVLNDLTKLVLVNAIYFKGNWEQKFTKEATHKEPFYLSDKTQVDVDMMMLTGKKFHFLASPGGLKVVACRLPYAGDTLSMTILLPHEGVDITEVEAQIGQIDAKTLKQVLTEENKIKVELFLPKFKFEESFELSEVLGKMGAPDAFDDKKADFSGIKGNVDDGLHISKVIHKAVVEVNEEGTEAAAATAAVMMTRCMVMEFAEEFKCNRPFLFIIHDNTHNTALFIGKYARP